jgi:PAS domain S-box-containing protein
MHDELRFIWEVSPIGLAKVARGGRFLAINPRFCEMVGYTETELLARTYQQITHPDDLDPDNAEAERIAHEGHGSYQMVKRYISKDGRSVWVNINVHAIQESTGGFANYFVFVAELTPINPGAHYTPAPPSNRISIWEYVRANPREAFLIGGVLFLLGQGRNLIDLIRLAWP